MINYYPYKSDKPNKKYYIITNDNKKVYLVPVIILILQFIKMKQENKDILIDIRRMNINIGINQELIHLHFGLIFCYGIYQQ